MSKYPARNPETAHRAVNDEGGLVVLPSRSEVKVLNPVGSRIFTLLDGEHSLEQIVQSIVDEFEVGPEQADSDVRAFLGDLEKHGMLASSADAGEEGR